MTIHQITFSPTGGTRRVSELLCAGIGTTDTATELCSWKDDIAYPDIAADDLVVISMPVFAGRVPMLAVERLKRVSAHGARCVIVAVYGNRAYDDALVEIQDIATAAGFRVMAAVTAIAEHSVCRQFAAGRPDASDAAQLGEFGAAILARAALSAPIPEFTLPGHRPYREYSPCAVPEADARCQGCGACAAQCPTRAIAPGHPQTTDPALCISCMRCVQVCPVHARGIGQRLAMLAAHLEPLCRERQENRLYLP